MWVLPWWSILEHLFPHSEGYTIHEHPPPTIRPRTDKRKAVELMIAHRHDNTFRTVAFVQLNPPQGMENTADRIAADAKMSGRFCATDVEGNRCDEAVGISAFGPNIALYNFKHDDNSSTMTGREFLHQLAIMEHGGMHDGDQHVTDASEIVHEECPRSLWATHVLSDEGYRVMVAVRDHIKIIVSKHLPPHKDVPDRLRIPFMYAVAEFDVPSWLPVSMKSEREFWLRPVSLKWEKQACEASYIRMANMDVEEPHAMSWVLPWWPILARLFPYADGYSIHEYPSPSAIFHKDQKKVVELRIAYRDGDVCQVVAFLQLHSPQSMAQSADRIALDKKMRHRFFSLFRDGFYYNGHYEVAVGISAIGGYIALYTSRHYHYSNVPAALRGNFCPALQHDDARQDQLHCFDIKPNRILPKEDVRVDDEPGKVHDECPRKFWRRHVLSEHGYELMVRFQNHVSDIVSKYVKPQDAPEPPPTPNTEVIPVEAGKDDPPERITGPPQMDKSSNDAERHSDQAGLSEEGADVVVLNRDAVTS